MTVRPEPVEGKRYGEKPVQTPKFFSRMMWVALMWAAAGTAHGQTYPSKPVRIVTTVTGGSLDLTARFIAPKLSEVLGQSVIVDNRGGVVSMELVAQAPADGYTLLLASASLWLSQFMRSNVPWDAVHDYAPITMAATLPNIIAVHPSLPVNSVKALIALARARPGDLNYASGQTGSSSHLAGELFKSMAGINMVRIAYKGAGLSMVALITGETQVSFPNTAAATPHLRGGKIKGLAVTTLKPSALVPELPTAAASGLPGYESRAILGIFAPAKTPQPIIDRLNGEIVRILNNPDVKKKLFDSGAEAMPSTPSDLAKAIKTDMDVSGRLITHAGIRAQ
jgi:tripartite-type tricarboxylate transporter receptor subunit TctC